MKRRTAIPGVDAAAGGAVSSLPVIRDLASDRSNVTPFVSHVEDYIDADRVAMPPMMWDPNFAQLKFANHDALPWGFDASAEAALWSNPTWGDFGVTEAPAATGANR